LTEREVNLQIARRLKRVLEQHGARVVMTRNGMENVPLYDRPKIAQEEKADIFISIHNNAHPDGVNPFVNTGTSVYFYHQHSKKLAASVHEQLLKALDIGDQGLYQGNFAVLRPPSYLSILIECAFIIHPEQEVLLRQEDFQEKIVKSIYKGLEKFLRETD
jgi:N-acetylmuramoyl-L-alanine amidase